MPPNPQPLTNGRATNGVGVDPAVLLLVEELRRGNDALRAEMVSAQKETTDAIRGLSSEMSELRKQAPGRLSVYLSAAIVTICLVALVALIASRGIDPRLVTEAVRQVAPASAP